MTLSFDHDTRLAMLRASAPAYVQSALENALTEYPVYPMFIATGPDSYRSHRDYHPAFFGSFDWHSCVEMHWVAIRLSRLFPHEVDVDSVVETLLSLLTREHLEREIAFFEEPEHATLERPYGWGWLFRLAAELHHWTHPAARKWQQQSILLPTCLWADSSPGYPACPIPSGSATIPTPRSDSPVH